MGPSVSFGMVIACLSLVEFLLHHFSQVIGYAKDFVLQIRPKIIFVSQQFSELSPELEQHPAEHEERHFAEPEDSPYYGHMKREEEVRYYGQDHPSSNVNVRKHGCVFELWK